MSTKDHDWIYKRWLEGGILNLDYEQGVKIFLDFVFSRPKMGCNLEIPCPCNWYTNWPSMEWDNVNQHLYYYVFMSAYYI